MNDSKLINKNMGRAGMRNMNRQRMYSMNNDVNNSCTGCASNRRTNNNNNNNNNNNSNNTNNNINNEISMDKRRCMQNIYELGFVLTESILYLDTHPDDTEAIEYYSQMRDELLKHMDYYAKNFGPLNYFNIESKNYWTWVSTPMPWELQ